MQSKDLFKSTLIGVIFAFIAWIIVYLTTGVSNMNTALIIGMLIIYLEIKNMKTIKGGKK